MNKRFLSNNILLPIAIFLAFGILYVLITLGNLDPNPLISNPTSSVETSTTISSYVTAKSFYELGQKSSVILIARADNKGEVFNGARDTNNTDQPSSFFYGIEQIYEFQIIKVIKGADLLPETQKISVAQVEGMIKLNGKETVSSDEIEIARSNYNFIPVKISKTYLLFLSPHMVFPIFYLFLPVHCYPGDLLLQIMDALPQKALGEMQNTISEFN
jgi:hypothetical protein